MERDCKSRTIVWFRRDLRIEDNPALSAAARDGTVLPVFIWCPNEEGQFYPGRVSRWWLKESLIHLQHSLKSLGADLVLIKAQSTLSAMLDCINAVGATKVVFNHLYDPVSLVRDHNIKQKLAELGISVQSYNGDLIYEPWEVSDDGEQVITTFETYCDKCLNMPKEPVSHLPPYHLVQAEGKIENIPVDALDLEKESEKSSNALLGRCWSPGWSAADKVFAEFIEHRLLNYSKDRLRVAGNSTSLLSPYLHYGEISIRKIFQTVCMKQILYKNEKNSIGQESTALFLKSVGLREYARYICFNFPYTYERSLLSNLMHFPWDANQSNFKSWRQGRTGYPLVDAGMRELWATGWIHNRIRVIVSSFCVKFLLLPWQWGMKYFWDTLLDADLESDILGWQYISGSLPDGHELERMDSPEIQGFKFDPEGEYVRQWLPELALMPNEWIHHPYDAPPPVLRSSGVDLGVNYPMPIIDIDDARDRLTEAINIMRGKEATAKAEIASGTNEVVVDNDNNETNADLTIPKAEITDGTNEVVVDNDNNETNADVTIPKADVREKVPPCTTSSYDQMVPSMGNSKNGVLNRKRLLNPGEENDREERRDEARSCNSGNKISKMDDDLGSTAESSSKKQITSKDESCQGHDCSTSSKNG